MLCESFCDVLEQAGTLEDKVFYDLGSGVGKKAFIASLGFQAKKSIGIEILPLLHQTALTLQQKTTGTTGWIEFIHRDFTLSDFSDADVVFLSMTMLAMEIELTGTLAKKLDQLNIGSTLITTGYQIPSPKYTCINSVPCEFVVSPRGIAYIQKKIS